MRLLLLLLCLASYGPVLAQESDTQKSTAGTINLSLDGDEVKEINGKVHAIVSRDGGATGRVSVTLQTAEIEGKHQRAEAGVDFEKLSTELVFADGDNSAKRVVIPIMKDGKVEGAEHFNVLLVNPTGGATLGKDKAKVAVLSPLVTNDAIVLGILCVLLAIIFVTAHSENPALKKFYRFVPALLLCYFLPSILSTFNVFSADVSSLYFVASRYLLPACLVMLCLSIDLKGIINLGPKALIMFFTGTVGVMIGGPLALFIMAKAFPDQIILEGADATWRGMSTVAGSWIGGGANQAAMMEVFNVGGNIFSAMVTVDVIVANVWMACILFMAAESDVFDAKFKADNKAIKELQAKMSDFQKKSARIPTLIEVMKILGIGFGVTAIGHAVAGFLAPILGQYQWAERISLNSPFFWLIVVSTGVGLCLSFTKLKDLEGAGASRVGSAFLYILVASIGMKMDLMAIIRSPFLFLIGGIWISIHAILLITVAKIIKAPTFFLAVGSQANIGGAASAPVVASAFHPTLAPVGVLLAVFGYFVGTIGAWLCGIMMKLLSEGLL